MNESDIDPEFAHIVAEQIAIIKEIDAVLMTTYKEAVKTMDGAMRVLENNHQKGLTNQAELEYATNLWLDNYLNPLLEKVNS